MSRVFAGARIVGMLLGALLCVEQGIAQTIPKSFDITSTPQQKPLVNGLREVSGLAMASDISVYAHNDEFGIVYEVRIADGEVVSAFALGDPTVSADFEGIAADNERVYLVTSRGLIYEALIGAHRSRVLFNVFDTGIGAFCEVEGLSRGHEAGSFLVLCKTGQVQDLQGKLTIYNWNVRNRRPVAKPWLQVPYKDFLNPEQARIFRPSAVEWDDKRQALVILSARSRQLAIVGEDGTVLMEKALSSDLHPQAEGVAITPSGDLIIADEGAGRGPGMLSLYKMQR